jgi:hypothetical protein
MRKRLALLALIPVLSLGAALITPGLAQADTDHYVCDENALCVTDPGLHNQVYVSTSIDTIVGFEDVGTYDGPNAYLMRINDGSDCLTVNVDSLAVDDEGCKTVSNEEWLNIGDWLISVWASANFCAPTGAAMATNQEEGATPANDLSVFCDVPTNHYDQWLLS